MVECTREWMRVLKPSGSMWINLGDTYASRATPERAGSSDGGTRRGARPGRPSSSGGNVRAKSLYGQPWRYALACVDDLGLILRRDQIWRKVNPLPESVTDRTRSEHEYVFHLTKEPRYYASCDAIREPHSGGAHARRSDAQLSPKESASVAAGNRRGYFTDKENMLGKMPGSVWDIQSEPLVVPDHLGIQHFAAFPTELPRRIILGWSPSGICTSCDEGRKPRASTARVEDRKGRVQGRTGDSLAKAHGPDGRAGERYKALVAIDGEVCGCAVPSACTRPAVVLDPFGGTGTTALVAAALGRTGISIDRSADYCRLASWRTTDRGEIARAMRVARPEPVAGGQLDLLEALAGGG
jgi:DNA modification methylase